MNIAIIDADIVGRKKHRFPNLACMKLSGYYKQLGHNVRLETTYDDIEIYDKVFISKVFTDTPVPDGILNLSWVEYGETGFYFDKAPNLPDEIEHHMPDYHLYDEWIEECIANGAKRSEFKGYTDYSIGFLTRGCFRKCDFCVNKKYDRAFKHSPLEEFYDPTRSKICLLDDNFFSCANWRELFEELVQTGKPFQFKQGLDERLLTDEKCEALCSAKYDGSITFAFDNIADYKLIEKKLQMIRRHTKKQLAFYVLVGFDRSDKWDDAFWRQDVIDAFARIELLMKYGCNAYIMRYKTKGWTPYEDSPYRGIYITLARWCNQPSFLKKKSFREFCNADGNAAAKRYMIEFETLHKDVAERFFDIRWEDYNAKFL